MGMNCEMNTYQYKLRYRRENFTIDENVPPQYGVEGQITLSEMST